MFGFVVANTEALTDEQTERYKGAYCGLCRTLQKRHGDLSRLTLNYDMTFLVLLLQSLYEPEEPRGKDTCLPHPLQARAWQRSFCRDFRLQACGYRGVLSLRRIHHRLFFPAACSDDRSLRI